MFWAAFLTKIAVVRRGRCMCVMNRFLTSARLYLALSSRLSQHFPQQCMPGVFAGGPQACCSWQKKQKQKWSWRTLSVHQSTPSFSPTCLFFARLFVFTYCVFDVHLNIWEDGCQEEEEEKVELSKKHGILENSHNAYAITFALLCIWKVDLLEYVKLA